MNKKITGDELITGIDGMYTLESRNAGDGMTLRQKALLEFMCALVSMQRDAQDCATLAEKYVTAYLNQLNK